MVIWLSGYIWLASYLVIYGYLVKWLSGYIWLGWPHKVKEGPVKPYYQHEDQLAMGSKSDNPTCNIGNTCMYACILYDAPLISIPFIVIFQYCNHVVVCACNNQF